MRPDYVFDAEPLIAFLYDEPGATTVAEHLEAVEDEAADGAISHATAAEIAYKVARLETGDPNRTSPSETEIAVGEDDVRALQDIGVSIETPAWKLVSRIKADGGISLGDSYAAALAAETDATLIIGTDPEFDSLPIEIDLLRIR